MSAEVQDPAVAASGRPGASLYDLSVRLYLPQTLFEERIDQDRWVLFAPDFAGLPILIDQPTRALLHAFKDGATVTEVLAYQSDAVSALLTISSLEERGFLRAVPATLPYPVPPLQRNARDFSIWLHITNLCNLKCAYCFVGEKTNEGMTTEVMEQVAANIRSTVDMHGTQQVAVKFAGGEPTISVPRMEQFRNILLKTMEGSSAQVRFAVLSNGTLVTDRLVRFLTETGTAISISLDGYGDAHDIFRVNAAGRGTWDTVSASVEMLIAHGIRPYIMGTISRDSCKSLSELVSWIYAHGLNCRLSVVRNPGSSWAGGDRRREYAEYNQILADAFDRAFALLEDPDLAIDLRYGLDLCELEFDHPSQGITCGTGDSHLVIKPDGSLVACPMTIQDKGIISAGDLLATARATFEHSPAERHYERLEDDCLSCRWFGVCSGGCPVTNLRVKGHAFTRSPLCSFYQSVIPRYLRFFGTKMRQAEERFADPAPGSVADTDTDTDARVAGC